MSPFLIAQAVFVGSFASLGILAACAWLFSPHERKLLVFSLHCLLCAALSGWLVAITQSSDLDVLNVSLHGRSVTALLMMITNLSIVSRLTEVRATRYIRYVAVFVASSIVIDLAVQPAVGPATGVRQARTAWGEEISMPVLPPPSVLLALTYAVLFSVQLFGLYASWRLWRRDRSGGLLVGLATSGTMAGYVVGVLADLLRVEVVYVGAPAVAAWVLFIALVLSREYTRRGDALAENERQSRTLVHALGERVKELRCLHDTTGILQDDSLDTAAWFREIVHILPSGWQYPQDTAARIAKGDLEFTSPGFVNAPWLQRAEFATADGATGVIEVVYLTEKPASVEGPFLQEERNLITSLAEMIRSAIDRRIAVESLRNRNNLYAMLAHTNRAVSRCTSAESLYRELCEIAVNVGRFQFAWVGVPDDTRLKCLVSAGQDSGYMNDLVVSLDENDPRSHGPTGRAFLTGCSYVVNDFMTSPMTAPWRAEAKRAGFAASAAFPLKEDGRVVAVFTVYAPTRGFFTEDLVQTLGEIAPSVSFALDALVRDRSRVRAELSLVANEMRMREEKEFTETLMDSLPGLVYLHDGTRMLKWNKVVEEVTGHSREEIAGLSPLSFFRGDDAAAIAKAVQRVLAVGHDEIESNLRTKDLRSIPYYFKGVRLHTEHGPCILGFGIDISEKRRLEEQFHQAQKMEAIGQLAGGIAHDFNNLLTVISGYSELLLTLLPESDLNRDAIEEIFKAGERAASLTTQLLAFSRQTVLQPKVLSINDVVKETDRMLRRLIGEDVRLEVALAPAVSLIRADPGHLSQVVVNLVVNARDAMPTGGRLRIETADVLIDEEYCKVRTDARPGVYACLSVEDTGTGMTPDVRDRIFEPFFTTKGVGKGTGLGLAMVHGIVQQSGGHIEVESELGRGTTFRLYFLASTDGEVPRDERADVQQVRHGTETILLVEDEDAVRALSAITLESHGYKVFVAESGADALKMADEAGQQIDLLVTDVVMPELSGRELTDALLPRFSNLRVLFVSGYTDDAVVRHGLLQEKINFLQKPFTPLALARKVREVLDGVPAAAM